MFPDLQVWLAHCQHHGGRRRSSADNSPDVLTGEEQRLIAPSIAGLQLGERSAARTLLLAARRLAQTPATVDIARIAELLGREQRRHAALLRAFMTRHDIPVKRRSRADRMIVGLSTRGAPEHGFARLATAELIGTVCYRALEIATDCRRLKALCRRLVADELAHAAFESELILALRARQPVVIGSVLASVHRTLFLATALLTWHVHRRLLRRAGYRPATFLRACRAQYSFYLQPLRPPAAAAPPVQARPDDRRTLGAGPGIGRMTEARFGD